MNSLIPFNYNSKQVRVIERNGEPWFVAKDVCDILEISNGRDAVSRLDEDERIPSLLPTEPLAILT